MAVRTPLCAVPTPALLRYDQAFSEPQDHSCAADTFPPDDAAIEREFNLVRTEWQFPASYNVAPSDDAFKLLRQYPDPHIVTTPVSKLVNSPKNNDAELIVRAMVRKSSTDSGTCGQTMLTL
jgi:hypothetical protein